MRWNRILALLVGLVFVSAVPYASASQEVGLWWGVPYTLACVAFVAALIGIGVWALAQFDD